MIPDILYKLLNRNLPQSLQDTKCWTLGKQVDGQNRAFQLDGCTHARNNHHKDWHTFDTCVNAAAELPEVDHLHVATGADLGNDLVLAGFDFDDCVHPETDELDCRVNEINRHIGSYFEFSPSRTGFRILVQVSKGTKNISKQKQGFEFFADRHFLSVCGNSNGVFRGERDHDTRPLITATADQIKQYYDFHNSVSAAFPADIVDGQRADYQLIPKKKRQATMKAAKTAETEAEIPVDVAKEMVKVGAAMACLSAERAEYYDDWMPVMYGLKGAIRDLGDEVSERCRELWHAFSQLSDKYNEGYCEEKWGSFTEKDADDEGYRSIGSLIHAAKEDAAKKFQELMEFKITDRSTTSDEEDEEEDEPILQLQSVADVRTTSTQWLLPQRIPCGKLSILAGDGGKGKTTLACDLAARITTGQKLPGSDTRANIGSVVIISDEEDEEDISKRVRAANGDPSKVFVLAEDEVFDTYEADTPKLFRAIEQRGDVRLVVFDTLPDFIGAVNDHRNPDVRRGLRSLIRLSRRTGIPVLGLCHFNKNVQGTAAHRLLGSVAYVNLPRSVLYVLEDPDNENRRILHHEKSNLAPKAPPVGFSLEQLPDGQSVRLRWESGAVSFMDLGRCLGQKQAKDTKTKEAADWLRRTLKKGNASSGEIVEQAAKAAITRSTLYRAAERIGAIREGGIWSLDSKYQIPNT